MIENDMTISKSRWHRCANRGGVRDWAATVEAYLKGSGVLTEGGIP
jgi:hypothetical protein